MGCQQSTIDTLDASSLNKKIELMAKPDDTLSTKKLSKNKSNNSDELLESDAATLSTMPDAEYTKVVRRRQFVISQSLLCTRF